MNVETKTTKKKWHDDNREGRKKRKIGNAPKQNSSEIH